MNRESKATSTQSCFGRLCHFPIPRRAAMKLRPIKTAADYRAALADVERLFEARHGTPAGDRLDILTTLVESYEEEHWPLPSPDPVEAIRYTMESRGLTKLC